VPAAFRRIVTSARSTGAGALGEGVSPSVAAGSRTAERGIPEATIARLPVYLRALISLSERGTATCSSEELATAAGVNSAKLRKDLSYLGSYGTRGVGYDVEYLRYQIAREIGVTQDWPVVIVGIGNLGHALANYAGFRSRGFRIVALLDSDPARHGEPVGDMTIRGFDEIDRLVEEHGVAIGVVATPADAAQDVADRLVKAGVTSILNFAPAVLTVPEGVDVRKVDLSIELQILAYHEQRKALALAAGSVPPPPETAAPAVANGVVRGAGQHAVPPVVGSP
jgi:redox-sensing transcriptional repressor